MEVQQGLQGRFGIPPDHKLLLLRGLSATPLPLTWNAGHPETGYLQAQKQQSQEQLVSICIWQKRSGQLFPLARKFLVAGGHGPAPFLVVLHTQGDSATPEHGVRSCTASFTETNAGFCLSWVGDGDFPSTLLNCSGSVMSFPCLAPSIDWRYAHYRAFREELSGQPCPADSLLVAVQVAFR